MTIPCGGNGGILPGGGGGNVGTGGFGDGQLP